MMIKSLTRSFVPSFGYWLRIVIYGSILRNIRAFFLGTHGATGNDYLICAAFAIAHAHVRRTFAIAIEQEEHVITEATAPDDRQESSMHQELAISSVSAPVGAPNAVWIGGNDGGSVSLLDVFSDPAAVNERRENSMPIEIERQLQGYIKSKTSVFSHRMSIKDVLENVLGQSRKQQREAELWIRELRQKDMDSIGRRQTLTACSCILHIQREILDSLLRFGLLEKREYNFFAMMIDRRCLLVHFNSFLER